MNVTYEISDENGEKIIEVKGSHPSDIIEIHFVYPTTRLTEIDVFQLKKALDGALKHTLPY